MASKSETAFSSQGQDPLISKAGLTHLWIITIWIGGCLCPFAVLALFFFGYYTTGLVVLAAMSYSYIVRPKRKEWWVKFLFNGPAYYPSYTLTFEEPLDRTTPFILCGHPHGIYCWGFIWSALNPIFRGVRFLMAQALNWAPFFHLTQVCWTDVCGPADKDSMIRMMKKGENLAILPGGFEEATITFDKQDRVYIKARAGFIKYALQYGYRVYPSYTFGENRLYTNVQGFWKFRLWLNSHKLPAVLSWGLKFCPILPRRDVPIKIVVGPAIHLPKIPHPSKEQVAEYHQVYIKALTDLYERHKDSLCSPQLEIW